VTDQEEDAPSHSHQHHGVEPVTPSSLRELGPTSPVNSYLLKES
jgi:hypothetical protein